MTRSIIQILSLSFGFGSWIAITGLWLEIPLLIESLPESWSLASHMNVMIQIANIGPLIYWWAKHYKLVDEVFATHLQFIIAFFSILSLIFAWNKTFYIFGSERSVVLLMATFGLGLLDCTSSVTFLPFMARFDSKYLTPYLIGEGLSGFIPSMVALAQGVEDDNQNECNDLLSNQTLNNATKYIEPRFSVEIFCGSLLITLFVSWISFGLLLLLPIAKEEAKFASQQNATKNNDISESYALTALDDNCIADQNIGRNNKIHVLSRINYIYLLGLICWSCVTSFGIMPSLQPYSSLPYGNHILHYVVIAATVSYPIGCFLALFVRIKSLKIINALTIFGNIIALYITICALMSPEPPMINHLTGGAVMVILWISYVFILSYIKTVVTLIISEHNGDKGLFYVGMNTQFGSAFGAAFIFILINHTNVFNESKCQ